MNPAYAPGMCVVAHFPKSKRLTHGKEYVVMPFISRIYSDAWYLFVIDDTGKKRPYGIKNFVPKSKSEDNQ